MLGAFSVLAQGIESMVVRWAKHSEREEGKTGRREGRREGEKKGGVDPEV